MAAARKTFVLLALCFCLVSFGNEASNPSESPKNQTIKDLQGDPLPAGAFALLGTLRLHHVGDSITSLTLSPDGKMLVTGGGDKTVRFWDTQSGREINKVNAPELSKNGAVLSPDGKLLATAGMFGVVRLWDVGSGKEIAKLRDNSNRVVALAFSPDGRFLAGASFGTTFLWDVASHREVVQLKHQDEISSLVFFPDGKRLAAGGGHSVHFWNVPSGEYAGTLWKSEERVNSVSLSPDGRQLLAACRKTSIVKDIATGKEVLSIPDASGFATFSPDGSTIAVSSYIIEKMLSLRDAQTGNVVRLFPIHNGQISGLAFSKDGKTLAAVWGAAVQLWDVATGKELLPFLAHRGGVHSATFSRDGSKVMTASSSGQLFLWESASGRSLRKFPFGARTVDLSPSAETFVVTGTEGMSLWDVRRETKLRESEPSGEVYQVAIFSRDEKTLITGSNRGRICIWDFATAKIIGELLRELRSAEVVPPDRVIDGKFLRMGRILTLALSANNRILAAAGDDPEVHLWRVADGKNIQNIQLPLDKDPLATHNGRSDITSLSISSDGRVLAAGAFSHGTYVWDVEKATLIRRFPGITNATAALSPDGKFLATGWEQVLLYELATGNLVCELKGHQGGIRSLAFSSDNKTLASTSSDHTALLWNLRNLPNLAVSLPQSLSSTTLLRLWKTLDSSDAPTAYRAMNQFIEAGAPAARFLTKHLEPAPIADVTRIQRLISDLESNDFTTRENAFDLLKHLGPRAEPQLRQSLEATLELEAPASC